MILIGIGGNIASAFGQPPDTFRSALAALTGAGVNVQRLSSLYLSPPWPLNDGPEFFNQVAVVETRLAPGPLLQLFLKVETAHGRARRDVWGPRTLDLDILDYQGLVTDAEYLALPHPWIEERAFVLKPIVEIAPSWRHPVTDRSAIEALSSLDRHEAESCRRLVPA